MVISANARWVLSDGCPPGRRRADEYSGHVPITSEPVSCLSGGSPSERSALALELAATAVDLHDPEASAAVVDLVVAVHDLLSRP